jgi:hypothetical protein
MSAEEGEGSREDGDGGGWEEKARGEMAKEATEGADTAGGENETARARIQ